MRWVLPDHIQDALPSEAAKLEGLRVQPRQLHRLHPQLALRPQVDDLGGRDPAHVDGGQQVVRGVVEHRHAVAARDLLAGLPGALPDPFGV